MLHIVLLEPEIPGNTGSVIRLSANTGTSLHLVHPLGFSMETAALRRAGLDYHEWARVHEHDSLAECLASIGDGRVLAFTGEGRVLHHKVAYLDGDILLFGRESVGLPLDVITADFVSATVRIPMRPESRSLNLANSVAVATYEALRQLNMPNLT